MGGTSLWLIPRENNPFTNAVQELITDTVPSNFAKTVKTHNFIPHVTLTSDIDPGKTYEKSGESPQAWLDGLELPNFRKEFDEVIVELDHVEAGEKFFRKLAIEVNENDNLKKLATLIRKETVLGGDGNAAQKWVESEYKPHMSLLYTDLETKEVKNKVTLVELQIGFGLGSLFDCCGGTLTMGGSMVLVDTSKPVDEWEIVARRETPWVMWRMSRNLA